jgi:hypothetical protein
LEDYKYTVQPRNVRTELKIQEVAMLGRANHSQMIDKIAAAAGISHGTCHRLLSDNLNMSSVTEHSVPRVLTQDQYDNCISICDDLIDSADKDGLFPNRNLTGDETWRFLYNPQLKRQSATWKSPSSP